MIDLPKNFNKIDVDKLEKLTKEQAYIVGAMQGMDYILNFFDFESNKKDLAIEIERQMRLIKENDKSTK